MTRPPDPASPERTRAAATAASTAAATASTAAARRPAQAVVVEPATADQILAAAARLFGRQGWAATTLRQIAEEAGIKAGSIYYHFEGKEEIAARVLDAGILALTDAVQRHRAALPPGAGLRAQLAAAVEGHLWGMLHNGDFTAAHIRIYRHVSDTARERHRPVRQAYTRLWDDLLAEAAASGTVRGDVPVTMIRQFLVGALNWPVDWYDPERGSFERFAHQITALVFDGIALGPEATH